MDDSQEHEIFKFICRANIQRFKRLLVGVGDENRTKHLRWLLAREEAKLLTSPCHNSELAAAQAAPYDDLTAPKAGRYNPARGYAVSEDQEDWDDELLALSVATRRLAQSVGEPAIRERLARMADELLNLEPANDQA
jgi:hypothetical protein